MDKIRHPTVKIIRSTLLCGARASDSFVPRAVGGVHVDTAPAVSQNQRRGVSGHEKLLKLLLKAPLHFVELAFHVSTYLPSFSTEPNAKW